MHKKSKRSFYCLWTDQSSTTCVRDVFEWLALCESLCICVQTANLFASISLHHVTVMFFFQHLTNKKTKHFFPIFSFCSNPRLSNVMYESIYVGVRCASTSTHLYTYARHLNISMYHTAKHQRNDWAKECLMVRI